MEKKITRKQLLLWGFALNLLLIAGSGIAGSQNIGNVASIITSNFAKLAKLMTACCYLAGIGFSIGAIMKFKQHKDNPTQVPVGTPIALVFIAAALLFLPTILSISGATIFGGSAKTGGATGIEWKMTT
jgi:intracellular multiplication protein IcmD